MRRTYLLFVLCIVLILTLILLLDNISFFGKIMFLALFLLKIMVY